MKYYKWSILPVAALLLVTLLMACSQPAPSPTPAPSPSPTASPKPSATASPTATPTAKPVAKQQWRFASTEEGTYGFEIAVGIAKVANQYNPNTELTILTAKSAPVTNALYEKNELDTAFGSQQTLLEVYTNKGIYEQSPIKYRVYQGVYMFTSDHFFVIKAGKTGINSLADLAGKKVFPYQRGGGAYDTHKLILTTLGIWDKMTDRQMGRDEAADALQTGAIDAVGAYTTGQASLPGWVANIDVKTQVQTVTPSAAEQEIIKKIPTIANLMVPASVFSKPVGVKDIWAYSNFYGYYFGPNEDTERVYGIVKSWYEHGKELVSISPGLSQFEKSGLQMNIAAIDSTPDLPVHPGVAKYYKEKGIWKSNWKIGEIYPRK
ncbi:MAG: TAXI family TRAP transporter solute-binding subunit [Dehalococcoidales bacterium]|nr:TAXI family TRAP transporter solute-binding subunit [Dehalococcoidales bacterium]